MPKKKQQQQHYGLAVDLISSIGNENMLDIIVEANDGGEIPASRFVLGARSTILQKMLFDKDQMGSRRLVLNYSSNVVRTLVHYCRTNELDQGVCFGHSKDEAAARELVKLCDCANSFELEGLQELVCDLVSSLTKTHPHLSCAIYDQAAAYGDEAAQVEMVKSIAFYAIRQNPEAALLRKNEFGNRNPGISSLSPAVVEEVLADPRMCTEEITMFRAVAVWADARNHILEGVKYEDSARQLKERRLLAKQITSRCIDLSKIAPSELLGIVSESGLVDAKDVSNALIQLALRVEKEGVQVSKRRAISSNNQSSRDHCLAVTTTRGRGGKVTEENSVAADVSDDITVSTYTSDTSTRHSSKKEESKKKKKQQQPPMVTPQRTKPKPRVSSTPPSLERGACGEMPRTGTSFRQAVGLYLADKVDTLCIRPTDDIDLK